MSDRNRYIDNNVYQACICAAAVHTLAKRAKLQGRFTAARRNKPADAGSVLCFEAWGDGLFERASYGKRARGRTGFFCADQAGFSQQHANRECAQLRSNEAPPAASRICGERGGGRHPAFGAIPVGDIFVGEPALAGSSFAHLVPGIIDMVL